MPIESVRRLDAFLLNLTAFNRPPHPLMRTAQLDMATLPARLHLLVTEEGDLILKEEMRGRPEFVLPPGKSLAHAALPEPLLSFEYR